MAKEITEIEAATLRSIIADRDRALAEAAQRLRETEQALNVMAEDRDEWMARSRTSSVHGDPTFTSELMEDLADAEPAKTPYQKSRTAFDAYAAMDDGDLPRSPVSALQVMLHRWEAREFQGVGNAAAATLGVNEETGELSEAFIYLAAMQCGAGRMAHAVLRRDQGIRGFDDPEVYKEHAADAIADVAIFAMQCATKLRLDFWQIVEATAHKVMERDWSTKTQPAPSAKGFTQVRGDMTDSGQGRRCCGKRMDEHYEISPRGTRTTYRCDGCYLS